jgi:hypothetical protein
LSFDDLGLGLPRQTERKCQSAPNFDPRSASNFDPSAPMVTWAGRDRSCAA